MPMTVLNNIAAQMTLGEFNKNITKLGKDLAKISKGERVYNAAADASAYSISEKMRTRLRALNQDERNVQNGVCMLRVAEGGVQDQIELMKVIKERVLNAANDSNTDEDRRIIQKEIDQFYTEIEDIAQKTVYKDLGFAIKSVSETGAEETYQFVLSANPANKYINTHINYHFFSIDISGCDSMNSVLDKVISGMKTVRSGQFAHFFDIEKNGDGTGISLTSKNYSTKSNNSEVIGISDAGYVGKAREEYIEMFARGEATLNKGFGYGKSHG